LPATARASRSAEVIRAVERATGSAERQERAAPAGRSAATDRRRRQDQGKVRLAAKYDLDAMVVSALKWERLLAAAPDGVHPLSVPVEELTDGYGRHRIEKLIQLLAKLPGLGRVSPEGGADMLKARHDHDATGGGARNAAAAVRNCSVCGNLDTQDPAISAAISPRPRDTLRGGGGCRLWALERSGAFRGRYHVLGGTLSPFQGIGPDDLSIGALVERARAPKYTRFILALNATSRGRQPAFHREQLAGAALPSRTGAWACDGGRIGLSR